LLMQQEKRTMYNMLLKIESYAQCNEQALIKERYLNKIVA